MCRFNLTHKKALREFWERYPIEAIRFRMEQENLRPQDLVPFLGSRSRVSEVLNGRRPLTLTMIRQLHHELGIPAEILLGEAETVA